MDLFSEEERNEIKSMIDDVHDTFMKDITIYMAPQLIVASFNDESFNSVYGRHNNGRKKKFTKEVAHNLKARILHSQPREDLWSDPEFDAQARIRMPSGSVRLRVNRDAYEILKEAKRVEIVDEGINYRISTDFRPHGVFENRYFDFFVSPIDEAGDVE